MTTSAPAIEATGLRKTYGDHVAVHDVDLTVHHGEVFALLGPNGAGKTTTVEILEGFRSRSGGAVRVLGSDPGDGDRLFKARIGAVLQTTGIDPYLTVLEVLEQYAGYYPSPRDVDELLHLVGLVDQRNQRVRRLSGGQQRRLDVAVGLVGDPELLFLDEPTTGFDPTARRQAWAMIEGLKALGKTVLLTTHYMEEAQVLADRVAVLVDGRIVACGTPEGLGGDAGATMISVRATACPPALRGAKDLGSGQWRLVVDEPVPILAALTTWANEGGHPLTGLEVRQRSLEDVYLDLTGGVPAPAERAAEPAPPPGRRRRR